MNRGRFITLEGVEGSGKSTLAERLVAHLRQEGNDVVLTKEPGGTPLSDRIRAILLDPQEEGMDPMAELFLYAASRRQHVVDVILPSLERGATVVCDRFTDATLAYQGFGRTLEIDRLRQLNDWATDSLHPDITVIFDIDEATGLDRARSRNAEHDLFDESRFEGEDMAFHRRVREGYLALAEAEPERYAVVDAAGTIDEVYERMIGMLEPAPATA